MSKIFAFINKQEMRPYMALGVVAFCLTYILLITFVRIPAQNKDLVTLGFGWVTGSTTMILAFYFGSIKKQPGANSDTNETN